MLKNYNFIRQRGALNQVTLTAEESQSEAAHQLPGDALLRGVIPQHVIEKFPESILRENIVFPLASDGETITVAASDSDDIALADKLRFITNRNIRLVAARAEAIIEAINERYPQHDTDLEDAMLCEFTDTATTPEATADQSSSSGWLGARETGRYLARGIVEFKKGCKGIEDDIDRIEGNDPTPRLGGSRMFHYIVEEGQRVLKVKSDGSMEILDGPQKVWKGRSRFLPMQHFVAHPGEFLVVRYRDGRQEHLPGPADIWLDPRKHKEIVSQEALQLAAKEAVVVYSQSEGGTEVTRRIVYGPGLFIPKPGEWLHTFSWHSSRGGHLGVEKVPNGLVFQKLWLMPDQMYHDVRDVRTSDDAVLTIRLMIFFELIDIEKMLDTTHDPIGDFVNAATSDVVDWVGKHDFEGFKQNTDRLNELEAYRQLTSRASQCGYRISKVVYRGYGAAESLQQMHDQAIEARTRLQLERATEQQAQDLENYKLDCQITRAGKRRLEQEAEVTHDLELSAKRQESELRQREARQTLAREQKRLQDEQQREHLRVLQEMGVDLTAYLTQSRADRVIELRGNGASPHLHLDQESES